MRAVAGARVIDQEPEAASPGVVHRFAEPTGASSGEVAGNDLGAPWELVREPLKTVGAPGDEDELPSVGRERPRECPADAARCTGYDAALDPISPCHFPRRPPSRVRSRPLA